MERSMRMRSDMGGCVLVRSVAGLPSLRNGLMMYIGAVALLADLSGSVEAASLLQRRSQSLRVPGIEGR